MAIAIGIGVLVVVFAFVALVSLIAIVVAAKKKGVTVKQEVKQVQGSPFIQAIEKRAAQLMHDHGEAAMDDIVRRMYPQLAPLLVPAVNTVVEKVEKAVEGSQAKP